MRGEEITVNIGSCEYQAIVEHFYDETYKELIVTSCYINVGDEDVKAWVELKPKHYQLIEKDVSDYYYKQAL